VGGYELLSVKLDDTKNVNNLKIEGHRRKSSVKCKQETYVALLIGDDRDATKRLIAAKTTFNFCKYKIVNSFLTVRDTRIRSSKHE
jgi:hypothetical protein